MLVAYLSALLDSSTVRQGHRMNYGGGKPMMPTPNFMQR